MENHKVSIITPLYNSEKFISETGYKQIQKFTAKNFTAKVIKWYWENFAEQI